MSNNTTIFYAHPDDGDAANLHVYVDGWNGSLMVDFNDGQLMFRVPQDDYVREALRSILDDMDRRVEYLASKEGSDA